MEINQIIEEINSFNSEGIKLACSSPPDYDQALALHERAAELARGNQELNPDYLAFSIANVGYARRRRGDSRNDVLSLLEDTLETIMDNSMPLWVNAESSRKESYAGRARLLEEIGLVRRYAPDQEDIGGDLKLALCNLEAAVQLYELAISNATSLLELEIISLDQLQNRKLRSIGVASTIAAEISRVVPADEIADYQKIAVRYAHDELSSRLSLGEESGFNLANAYHTLGVAQSELAGEQKEFHKAFYKEAKKNFSQARRLSLESGDPMTVSVLSFREAWLEYKRDHSDSESIRPHLALVLEYQKSEKTYWNKAVRQAIQPQMQILAAAVGGAEQSEIESWYK